MADWRSCGAIFKNFPLLSWSKSRWLMFYKLFFNIFDQAPTIFMKIRFLLSFFEPILWRQKSRFMKMAFFKLFCHFLVLGYSGVDIFLCEIVLPNFQGLLFFICKSFWTWGKDWSLVFVHLLSSHFELLLFFQLLLFVETGHLECLIGLLCLFGFVVAETGFVWSKGFVELFGWVAGVYQGFMV